VTSRSIFERRTGEIAAIVGTGCTLIDLGAGNCAKAERLFAALRPAQYVAVDIAADFLRAQLGPLAERHPEIDVIGVAVDFMQGLQVPEVVSRERRLAFIPARRSATSPRTRPLVPVDRARTVRRHAAAWCRSGEG
jgi:uncharacterized SAM-dependent methyltransferase